MQFSNESYFLDRERHDLALRMIRHEARTCTIRTCTGISEDRVRRLYKTYAFHALAQPIRRRRGKSPRQPAYFVRNVRLQHESSLLASTFAAFGVLLGPSSLARQSITFGRVFCDAYETHVQLVAGAGLRAAISFEHAWFLLQLLDRGAGLCIGRCRCCAGQYLRDPVHAKRTRCPLCLHEPRPPKRRRKLARAALSRPAQRPFVDSPSRATIEAPGAGLNSQHGLAAL